MANELAKIRGWDSYWRVACQNLTLSTGASLGHAHKKPPKIINVCGLNWLPSTKVIWRLNSGISDKSDALRATSSSEHNC